MNFCEWFKKTDARELESIYNKTHISVELVNQYNPQLLANISTIANLSSGAYGLYLSAENKKLLNPEMERRLIYWGRINKNNIGNIPTKVLSQYGIDPKKVQPSDTIHVNVKRILSQSKTDLEAVLQIASTIIHESVHELEREASGKTNETGPKTAENQFMMWAKQNLNQILRRYPELNVTS
jgi:hypothetical protein